jgi:Piwi domain
MDRDLVLNVAPVRIDDVPVPIRVLPFESREQLRSLRNQYSATHCFRREGDRLLCVEIAAQAPTLGAADQPRRLHDHPRLAAALVSDALATKLASLGRRIEGFAPISFLGGGESDNVLARLVPEHSCPSWLAVRPLFTLDVRVVATDRTRPFVGIAANVRSTRRISLFCDQLQSLGLDLVGLYAGRLLDNGDLRVAPYLQLLGRVASVSSDGSLQFADHREGVETFPASKAVLEARGDAFHRCMAIAFGANAGELASALDRELVDARSGPAKLDRLSRVVGFLGSSPLTIAPGVTAKVGRFLSEAKSDLFPPVATAPKAVYVFDAAGTRTDTWSDGGLRKHGPYSADVFTPSRPRICVICLTAAKGRVDQFLHKFLHGVQGDAKAPFLSGFVKKYNLDGAVSEFFVATDRSAAAYHRAARTAIERQAQLGQRWDLALVQIEEGFNALDGEENPYLVCKAAFLAQQVNVQEFEIETISVPDRQLGYVLNNMALATYAKLGGVPWLIRADRTITHELVIGLGSTYIGKGRLGGRERVVGITTVFSGDGNYYLSNLSKAVPLAEYRDALLDALTQAILKAQTSMNWQQRDPVRLVFHTFKPLKDVEVEVVTALVESLGQYNVEFAFVHLVEDHPFLLFDRSQAGVDAYGSRLPKGKYAPTRGWYMRLSEAEVLLSLTGARELKKAEDGLPWPVLLRLHRRSTFRDTTYLAKQVFAFSSHSWRSFFPSSMPVTVLYSQLVARLLGQMSSIPWWNADAMLDRVGRTRWFL